MESNISENEYQLINDELSLNSSQLLTQSSRHRFKVVKLVSKEPYFRGRWNCFDYKSENNCINDCLQENNQNINNVSQQTKQTISNTTNNETIVKTNESQISNQKTTDIETNANNREQTTVTTTENGVAIDNKIEQAMDLVKSHLMFAVREEVDVLKERIKELESEIQILRAHASHETLQLVAQHLQQINSVQNINPNVNPNINPNTIQTNNSNNNQINE